MKIKVAIIQPFIDDGNLTPPLGPLYIAALLEKNDFEVKFFDERIEQEEIVGKVIEFKPNIVGVGAVTAGFDNGINIVKAIIHKLMNINVIFGGPHVTALPIETMKRYDFITHVIVREGELPFLEYCQQIRNEKFEPEKIENFYYRKDGRIKFTKEAQYLTAEQLDELPMPAYHLLDMEKYFQADKTYGLYIKGIRNLPVMSSRGCPAACTFCCHMMGYSFRIRNYMNVVDEMEYLVKKYQLSEIHIVDDNFTFDKQRAMATLNEIIKRNLKVPIKFANGLRADKVDRELLEKMKEAGCYTVAFGIESGSESVLKMMKKKLSLNVVRRVVKESKEVGLLVSGNCIIGYPGETLENIKESLTFFHEIKLDSMAIVSLVPFPGTEAREIAEKNNWLTEAANDWKNYSFVLKSPPILISTPYVSAEKLKKIISQAYFKMYLRPSVILNILRNVKSPMQRLRGMKILFRS